MKNLSINSNYNFVCFSGRCRKNKGNKIQEPLSTIESSFKPASSENIKALYCPNIFSKSKIQKEIISKFIINRKEGANGYIVASVGKNNKLQNFSEDILKIMKKYSVNTPNKIIDIFSQTANISDKQIKKFSRDYFNQFDDVFSFNVQVKMKIKREFIRELVKSMEKFKNQNKGEMYISQRKLKNIIDNNIKKIENRYKKSSYTEKIKGKLQYFEKDFTEKNEKYILNENEIRELKTLAKVDENISYEELCRKIIDNYVSGDYSLKYSSANIQKAILYSYPKYNSTKEKIFSFEDFKYPPVVRWLYIKNPDELINKYKEGKIYKYPRLQSCSKRYTFGEHQFKDNDFTSNVKFVIHPKSETSNARDIGFRKYGNNEVIYPPNQKFVVIDRHLENFSNEEYDFYRWVIHLQEK